MLRPASNVGSNRVIFMIRHGNDLEFMLPIILYTVNNPVVFIWGDINKSDFRLGMLKKENIELFFLDGLYKGVFARVLLKFLKLSRIWLYDKYLQYTNDTMRSLMLLSLDSYLKKNINPNDVKYIVFDHTTNITVELMFLSFKAWSKNSVKFISLPHSQLVIDNKMLKYELITPDDGAVDWNAFDKMVFFNNHHVEFIGGIDLSKTIVLSSLRNTIEWVSELREKNPESNEIVKTNNRIRFLIIHSQLSSNINREEVVRMIRILDHFDCFDIRIKPHPRREADVFDLLKISKNISLIHDHITEAVHWSEYVLFFHSSAIHDVILLKKPIIYPSFASSNQLIENILSQCNVANTPDDFFNIVNIIVNKKDVVYPSFSPPRWDELVDRWGKLLN